MSAAALIALPLALLLPPQPHAQFAVARTVRAAPPRLGLFGRFRQKRAVEAAPQIEVGAEIPNVDVEIVPRTMLDDEPEEDVKLRARIAAKNGIIQRFDDEEEADAFEYLAGASEEKLQRAVDIGEEDEDDDDGFRTP